MKLLVVRPQPGADATAARIKAAGHIAVLMPLFEIRPVTWDIPSPERYDALLLTSSNAVRAVGDRFETLRELPVYAVGSATARAAHTAGLTVIATGESGVAVILETALTAGHTQLLWLAGEDRISVVTPGEMTLDTRMVYQSAALTAPADFAETAREVDAVLLHSPRAAGHFADLCDGAAVDRAGIRLAALSPAIAESAGSGWRTVVASTAPNDESLLSQLQSCFTKLDSDP